MELYHVVSFVLTYFVLSKCDYEKLEDDPLFNVIPEHEYTDGVSVRAVSHPHDSVDIQERKVRIHRARVGWTVVLLILKEHDVRPGKSQARTAVSRRHRNVVRPHVDIRADHTEGDDDHRVRDDSGVDVRHRRFAKDIVRLNIFRHLVGAPHVLLLQESGGDGLIHGVFYVIYVFRRLRHGGVGRGEHRYQDVLVEHPRIPEDVPNVFQNVCRLYS